MPDWVRIEAEYRAGQISIRQIAEGCGVSEGAIRKKAKKLGWVRALAERVREAVKEKLVREGTHGAPRVSDAEIIQAASERGFNVITTHRRDLLQLHGLKRVLADRLATLLQGGDPGGLCLGERESAGDLLEKLSRVTGRLVPLERQAHNLDHELPTPPGETSVRVVHDLTALSADELAKLYREKVGAA